MEFTVEPLYDGRHEVSFSTPFIFGDTVAYETADEARGEGTIAEILLAENGVRYYHVRLLDGQLQPGLRAEELQLIKRGDRY